MPGTQNDFAKQSFFHPCSSISRGNLHQIWMCIIWVWFCFSRKTPSKFFNRINKIQKCVRNSRKRENHDVFFLFQIIWAMCWLQSARTILPSFSEQDPAMKIPFCAEHILWFANLNRNRTCPCRSLQIMHHHLGRLFIRIQESGSQEISSIFLVIINTVLMRQLRELCHDSKRYRCDATCRPVHCLHLGNPIQLERWAVISFSRSDPSGYRWHSNPAYEGNRKK